MSKELYALVKWIGGEDDKKYTLGIPTDWIIGFVYEEYINDTYDSTESYVVEWRDKKQEPKGGWNCYDCHVILVSDKISQLEKHLKILEGAKSPKVVALESNADIENELGKRKVSSPSKFTPRNSRPLQSHNDQDEDFISTKRRKRHIIFDSDEETDVDEAGSSQGRKSKSTKNHPKTGNDNMIPEIIRASTPHRGVANPTAPEPRNISPKNDGQEKELTLADLMTEVRKNARAIEKLQDGLVKFVPKESDNIATRRPKYDRDIPASSRCKNSRDLEDGEFVEGNIEIGPPGSGIYVTDLQWTAAISKGTYKAMATTLVTALFPLEVLLKSNFKGGESRVKKSDASRPKYNALDGKIIKAIMYSVKGIYPKTFTEVGVGQAINVKLTNIRNKNDTQKTSEDSSKNVDADD